jgi:hypothetical protein
MASVSLCGALGGAYIIMLVSAAANDKLARFEVMAYYIRFVVVLSSE